MKLIGWNTIFTLLLAVVALAAAEAYLRWTIPPMREGQLF